MNCRGELADRGVGPDIAGTDRAALRRLFERLRDHLAQTEARAETALNALGSALTPDDDRAARLLDEQRGAARGLERLAGELSRMAEALERKLERTDDARTAALRAMDAELRAGAARLDARLAEAERQAEQARARFAERLGLWEAAAEERERRFTQVFAARLDDGDARRRRDVSEFVEAVARRTAEAPPASARRTARSSRSAALLLSAGVACLGLTTLAVLLEPPLGLGAARTSDAAQVVLRGPILIAPPRYASEDELAPAQPRAPAEADAQKTLAAAIGAVEAGRPGAVERLRVLADGGLPRAQMYLARLYEAGKGGLATNPVEARRWTARAADAGDPVAMHNLALYYLQGRGGARDDAVAAGLLKRAAARGLPDSQFNLGLLYETGAGVDRNLVEAYKWFQIAANTGDLKARARAIALEDRLAPRELAVVERIADRFVPGADEPDETVLVPGAETIAEAQKKLARLGFYIGPTDGQDTAAYRQAAAAYRRSQSAQSSTVAAAP